MKIVTHETLRKYPKFNEFSKKKKRVIKVELKSVGKNSLNKMDLIIRLIEMSVKVDNGWE